MTEFTANELNRLIQMLPITDPTTEGYALLLHNIETLAVSVETIDEILTEIERAADTSKIVKVEFRHPAEEEDESPFPEAEAEAPAQVVELPAVTKAGADIDLVTVRAALREAKKNGVDIKALLQEFGAANLADLPAEKYGDLLAKLEA